MATNVTTTTFGTTYKDDFVDSDHYHRILFNAGRALQARELTQMQTIIQEEIGRFGGNVFVEGAAVDGGNLHVLRFDSIKLTTAAATTLSAAGLSFSDLVGKEFTGTTTAIKFIVRKAFAAAARDDGTGNNPPTLFVEYTSKSAGTSGTRSVVIADGASFTNASLGITLQADSPAVGAAANTGTILKVAPGTFFVKNHFVTSEGQELVLGKYEPFGINEDVGFKIVEEVITSDDDNALFDNQGASPNISAPGADRYRITLSLAKKSKVTASENFVYLATISSGEISQQVTTTNGYNTIYDLMATRTKEESGDYTVNNFIAKFNEISGNDSNLDLEISGGTAYVDGYRLELPRTTLRIEKARDTITENNQPIIAQYGSFVIGNTANNKGLPNIDNFDSINLMDNFGHTGSAIGGARVRAVEEADSAHKFFLFDINMYNGKSFRDTRSFGTSATDHVNIVTEDGIAQLKETSNNSLLFPLPSTRPTINGVSDLSFTVQKRYTFSYSGGTNTLSAGGTGDIFTNTGDWIIAKEDSSNSTATFNLIGSPTGNQVEVSSIAGANGTYELLAYVAVAGANLNVRQKTLEAAQSITKLFPDSADSDGNGLASIDLGFADVHEVKRILTVDSSGSDLSDNFTFDNGQRDNFYSKSRLVVKPGVSIPSGNVFVEFRRFSHGSGDLFAVNSYQGAINYEDIPDFTKANGEIINLRDVLDFRPVEGTNGQYSGTGGIVNLLPQTTDVIRADVVYHLPRKDKLVIGIANLDRSAAKFGEYRQIKGVSALNPNSPLQPPGTLTLYDMSLKPFTLDKDDVTLEKNDTKNYTMQDIGKLEDRIDTLTELTTLSLLENETSSIEVLDSAGNARTKAGFLADNFANYNFSDTFNPGYRASIDQSEKELTPQFSEAAVRLIYDADNSGNDATRVGDLIICPYVEESFINQDLASTELGVNGSGMITNSGQMTLSPASDNWFETEYVPDIVIELPDVVKTKGSVTVRSRNDSKYSWYGTTGKAITGNKVVRDKINEVILEKKFVPYMRSIKVFFKARGLSPNTQHFAFFDEQSVADWVRTESTFTRFSETSNDYGSSLTGATGHPDGATTLTSDANGQIIGSFVIPSTSALKFRTGDVIFKLLDITESDDGFAASSAFFTFSAQGLVEVKERTFESTRHVTISRAVIQRGDGGATSGKRTAGYHNYNGGFYQREDGSRSDRGRDTGQVDADADGGSSTSSPF